MATGSRVVTLRDGVDVRWVVLIDGQDVPGFDVRHEQDPERGLWSLTLVGGGEEVRLITWRHEHGPLLETLGQLKRRLARERGEESPRA